MKIYAIDGRDVNIEHPSESGRVVTTRALLRPGTYQLALIPQHIETIKTFTEIRAELDAGRQYLVRTRRISRPNTQAVHYEFWVEDIVNGRVVSDTGPASIPFARDSRLWEQGMPKGHPRRKRSRILRARQRK